MSEIETDTSSNSIYEYSNKYAIIVTFKTNGTHRIIRSFSNMQSAINEFEKIKQNPRSVLKSDDPEGNVCLILRKLFIDK